MNRQLVKDYFMLIETPREVQDVYIVPAKGKNPGYVEIKCRNKFSAETEDTYNTIGQYYERIRNGIDANRDRIIEQF